MIKNDEYLQIDPSQKNEQWAIKLVTHYRENWKELVPVQKARDGMAIIMSDFDMSKIEKMFKDPKNIGMDIVALSIMEKVRNILISERVNAGITANLNALDPTADSQRKADKELLKNRKEIEQVISFMQQEVGLPEYKLEHEEKQGKQIFNGNVQLFDALGLDEQSGYQLTYFFQTWHKLSHEMRGQAVINHFIQVNEVKENVPAWCNDIMAKKAVAAQVYVNQQSGQIDIKYLAPEKVKVIPGKRADGKDAVCVGFEDSWTMGQVIRQMGNSFDWERDMDELIKAANYSGGKDIGSVYDNGNRIGNGTGKNRCNIQDFMNFQVSVGYVEWKSFDARAYKIGRNWHGNVRAIPKPVSTEISKNSGYVKELLFDQVTYRTYFIATSPRTQKLFQFGPLYHQAVEGTEDEYSCYSVMYQKYAGPTVAEVAHPWILIAQEVFTKTRWMVRRAKPKGRAYNYESLIKIAKNMIKDPAKSDMTKIHAVLKMFEEGINELFTIPEIDGQKVGGGVNPNYDLPNGLDESTLTFQRLLDWAVMNIKSDLGINDIREAYSPKANDGFKLQQATLEQSRNATGYMNEMIDGILRHIAVQTLAHTQDIIYFKDTIPYRYLQRAIGQLAIDDMKMLEKVAMHRYGIVVNSFATYQERQRVLQETQDAWVKGEISYEVKTLIDAIDDYRTAAYIISFEKTRSKKEKQEEIQRMHENQMQLEQTKHALEKENIVTKGQLEITREQVRGAYYLKASQAQAMSRIQINQEKIANKPDELAQKSMHKTEEKRLENSLAQQLPLQ